MRKLHFILLPLIAFALLACSEDELNPAAPAEAQVLMPLAVGNYWIYDEYGYANGLLYKQDRDTTRITSTIMDSVRNTYYLHDDNIPYRNSDYGLDILAGRLKFKYPASLGDRIVFPTSDPYAIEVINLDTTVTTPLGEFHCIRYSFGELNSEARTYYCFCPGVGLVRTDHFGRVEELQKYTELIEYHIQ